MTPQETELLNAFLAQLTQVRGIAKDPAADALIAQAVANQPDAAYLLVQRSLLQDQALEEAKHQIEILESDLRGARAPAAPSAGGFLSGVSAWGRKPAAAGAPAFAGTRNQTATPLASAPLPPSAPQQGGGSSFLGRAAATAAGVVGGAFLFQGISQLMGNHGNNTPSSAQQANPVDAGLLTNSFANDVEPADSNSMDQYDTAMDDAADFDDSSEA